MAYTFGNGDTSSLGSMEPDELSANSLQGVGLGFKRFIPKSIPAIWYDITHDNETFGKKRTF